MTRLVGKAKKNGTAESKVTLLCGLGRKWSTSAGSSLSVVSGRSSPFLESAFPRGFIGALSLKSSVCLCLCLSMYFCLSLSVCLSPHFFVSLSVCECVLVLLFYVSLPQCVCVCLCVCVCVCLCLGLRTVCLFLEEGVSLSVCVPLSCLSLGLE